MRLRHLLATTMALAVVGLSALFAGSASAQPAIDCTSKVADQTAGHKLDIPKIQAAITQVEHFGADVYVRAFEVTPGGSLDSFWESGLRACPNWRDSAGTTKNNVIFVGFGMDRNSAIFYGSNFQVLKGSVDGIRANDMNANFREGDFTEGVVDALDSVAADIDPHRPMAKGTDWAPVVKWILIGLGILIAGIALLLGLRGFLRWNTQRIRNHNEKLHQQAAAQEAKAEASALLTGAPTNDQLNDDFLIQAAGLPEEVVGKHRETLDNIQASLGVLAQNYNASLLAANMDPSSNKLSTSQYAASAKKYRAIVDGFEAARKQIGEMEKAIWADKANLSPEGRTKRLAVLNAAIAQLDSMVAECSEHFVVDVERKTVAGLEASAEEAQTFLDSGRDWESHSQLLELERRVEATKAAFAVLMADKTKIVGARQQLVNEVAAAQAKLKALTLVNTGRSLRKLDRIQADINRFLDGGNASKSRTEIIRSIDRFIGDIAQLVAMAVEAEAKLKQKKAREERDARQQASVAGRRGGSSSSRYGSSSSDGGFSGGFAGGYIGGSLGSSGSSHSSSSDSGSSSSWGSSGSSDGGSSGSWGGGGGFDGGSSGGW